MILLTTPSHGWGAVENWLDSGGMVLRVLEWNAPHGDPFREPTRAMLIDRDVKRLVETLTLAGIREPLRIVRDRDGPPGGAPGGRPYAELWRKPLHRVWLRSQLQATG